MAARDHRNPQVGLAAGIDAAYPASWGTELTVETNDGRRFTAACRDAKGDPENPVTAAELSSKARAVLGDGRIAENRTEALIAAILALPDDMPVRSLDLFPNDKGGRDARYH
jgi:2-methylcitrate dehydratase PrpD